MNLKLAFSTCPNDTFMFDAIVNKKIDLQGLKFEYITADISELNSLAEKGEIDIIKLSFSKLYEIESHYQNLRAGSALGYGNGPLLISKKKIYPDEVDFVSIAIPGKSTTANLLLKAAFPLAGNKKEYLFSDIEEVVLSGETDAGLIIHETRFTYESKGLKKIVDLGEWWEEKHKLPIPLGCIAAKKSLPNKIISTFDNILKESIEFAFKNPESSLAYIKSLSQEKSEKIINKHINLYVNKFSLDIGKTGEEAIEKLREFAPTKNNR